MFLFYFLLVSYIPYYPCRISNGNCMFCILFETCIFSFERLTLVLSIVICRWVALMWLHWISCHWLQNDKTHLCPNIFSFTNPLFNFKKLSSFLSFCMWLFYVCNLIYPISLISSNCCMCGGLQNVLLSQFELY